MNAIVDAISIHDAIHGIFVNLGYYWESQNGSKELGAPGARVIYDGYQLGDTGDVVAHELL